MGDSVTPYPKKRDTHGYTSEAYYRKGDGVPVIIDNGDQQKPWHIALLIHDNVWVSSTYGVADLLQSANLRHKIPPFQFDIIAPTDESVTGFCGHQVLPETTIDNGKHYDVIILCHFYGNFIETIDKYTSVPSWLAEQEQSGAIIAAVTSGIFWAAEAGLLKNRTATTYWRDMPELSKRYPSVKWTDSQSLVEDGGIYSSNGQNAAWDLTLHLVEKFCDWQVASSLARDITYDTRRTYDLTLFNIAGFRKHSDPIIHRAQDWLDDHYGDKVCFETLAEKLGMSKRTFIRRFQKAIGENPSHYLQRLRVEYAKQQLINSDENIKTISLNVGYRDFGYFSTVFKSIADLTPREFRARFRPKSPPSQSELAG